MPTKHRRYAITETPGLKHELDALRRELGTDRLDLSELVALGAQEKLTRLRTQRDDTLARRRGLAARIRVGDVPVDARAAGQVRRAGWARG